MRRGHCLFADYRLGPINLFATVRQAITHTGNGMFGSVGADYRTPVQTWFGVSQTQVDQSGLPVHNAGGGVKDVGLHVAMTYFYSGHVMLRLFGIIEKLTGDDANSPIVQDKTQSSVGFSAVYHF